MPTSPEAGGMEELIGENWNVQLLNGLLIARDIPYVTERLAIARGVLAFPTEQADGGRVIPSGDHTVFFVGEAPCDERGRALDIVAASNENFDIPGIGIAKLRFSIRPRNVPDPVYPTARAKLTKYAYTIGGPALRIDPTATPQTGGVPPMAASDCYPFAYPDSASTRVGITDLNQRFRSERVGIIGLGGTGTYILDLVAKTPVHQIILFDPDVFRSHNAFRTPGAASAETVGMPPHKATYFSSLYSAMHLGITAIPIALNQETAPNLDGLSFAFLSVDNREARDEIAGMLMERDIPFVTVGIMAKVVGANASRRSLFSRVNTAFWQPGDSPLFTHKGDREDDAYDSNIQIAELNSLNAALAVLRWKRYHGYYQDLVAERLSMYSSNQSSLIPVPPQGTLVVVPLRLQWVMTMPMRLEERTLYISRRFRTSSHLCPCGCGRRVVTPLKKEGWILRVRSGKASLYPSIGNWDAPCRSHYFILRNAAIFDAPGIWDAVTMEFEAGWPRVRRFVIEKLLGRQIGQLGLDEVDDDIQSSALEYMRDRQRILSTRILPWFALWRLKRQFSHKHPDVAAQLYEQ